MTDPKPCGEEGCERVSCLPADYAPLCARHYIASIDAAQKAAAARFQARIASLREARSHDRPRA